MKINFAGGHACRCGDDGDDGARARGTVAAPAGDLALEAPAGLARRRPAVHSLFRHRVPVSFSAVQVVSQPPVRFPFVRRGSLFLFFSLSFGSRVPLSFVPIQGGVPFCFLPIPLKAS